MTNKIQEQACDFEDSFVDFNKENLYNEDDYFGDEEFQEERAFFQEEGWIYGILYDFQELLATHHINEIMGMMDEYSTNKLREFFRKEQHQE